MSNQCQMVKMDLIKPAWNMLRPVRESDVEYLEMQDSIRDNGVLNSILVRPHPTQDGYYEVIDGMWRYFSVKSLDIPEIPCILKVGIETDEQYLALQIQCNAVTYDTRPIEFAEQMERLVEILEQRGSKVSITELARYVSKSSTWVSNRLKLLKLCDKAKDQIKNGTLTLGKAVALARVHSHAHQERLLLLAKDLKTIDFEFEIGKFIARENAKAVENQRHRREEVTLVPRLQSTDSLLKELDSLNNVAQLIVQNDLTTALEGARVTLEWVLNLHDQGRVDQVKEMRHKLSYDERRDIIGRRRYEELSEMRKLKEARERETRKSFGEIEEHG